MEATVTAAGLNLRARPDQFAHIKYALNHGDKLTLIGKADHFNWQSVRVQRTGDYGYVFSPYIQATAAPVTVSKQAPQSDAQPPPTWGIPITPEPQPNFPDASTMQPAPAPTVDRGAGWDTMIVPTIVIVAIIIALFWTLFAR